MRKDKWVEEGLYYTQHPLIPDKIILSKAIIDDHGAKGLCFFSSDYLYYIKYEDAEIAIRVVTRETTEQH